MINRAWDEILPVMARLMTEAKIGPTQGVQRRPTEKPINKPPKNPDRLFCLGTNFASLLKSCSVINCTLGVKRLRPKIIKIIIDANLRVSAGIPLSLTIVERKRVKKVKLAMNPVTTPSGRFFPEESTEEESIIGSIGRMQGERIVTIPARKAKAKSRIIT